MRVLQAHNYYQFGGGEDAVLEHERSLLTRHGHAVEQLLISNDLIDGPLSKLRSAWQAPYAAASRERMAGALESFRPDVVHVHNFFPLLTPAVYDACRDAAVPVVQTLHNYRTICAGAFLMREGRPCEDCVVGSAYNAVLHGCYRGSRAASLAVARMVSVHRRRRTWHTDVDRFIAMTGFAKSKFIAAGFPEDKIDVKPNFVDDGGRQPEGYGERRGALFVGHLRPEKGIATLAKAWSGSEVALRVAGAGPAAADLEAAPSKYLSLLGNLSSRDVLAEMDRAAYLVVPSQWYEGFPMVLVEAFSRGLPILASRIGALGEIVEDGVTGIHFTPGDAGDLRAKAQWATEHPLEMQRMGENARRTYLANYTPEINYRQLTAIYTRAAELRSRATSSSSTARSRRRTVAGQMLAGNFDVR